MSAQGRLPNHLVVTGGGIYLIRDDPTRQVIVATIIDITPAAQR